MSYKEHAEREMKALGYNLDDQEEGPNKWIMENIFELLGVFEKQRHSGSSAPYCAEAFRKLALFEPLSPLTGEDDEWVLVSESSDEPIWQNKRAGTVFKGADGQAYDIEGRVFREPDGCCYTDRDSIVGIVFPYVPTPEYVDVDG